MTGQAAGGAALPVRIPAGAVTLNGDLTLPPSAQGIVIFAHGSGSGRHSPRNRAVAQALNGRGLATLLLDLLTVDEEGVDARDARLRFDIGLLAERLVAATRFAAEQPETAALRPGFFGASTGGGAALVAAAALEEQVGAVVSRGGRPDLAGAALGEVRAPTLLIVGGLDLPVLELNQQALERLTCERRLAVVPGATHLFEEASTLEQVAALAGDWFLRYLGGRTQDNAAEVRG